MDSPDGDGARLILAPLSVAEQTIAEAAKRCGDVIKKRRTIPGGIWITNERMHLFSPSLFDAIVPRRNRIPKKFDGKTRTRLLKRSLSPFRIAVLHGDACAQRSGRTGQPWSSFGVMSRQEMLAMFFKDDSGEQRRPWLAARSTARQDFWRWVATGGIHSQAVRL